jgi:phytoene synthase
LLGGQARPASRALYAFCRVSDDIVDRTGRDQAEVLDLWRRVTLGKEGVVADPVALAWQDTRQRYQIPVHYAIQLLDGVSQDLKVMRYDSFDELAHYCYGVASTVGLMTMHIMGFTGEEALPYAIKLGVALQLTNILRDVGEDWANGRLYLPLDELAAFGLCESDIAAGRVTDTWRAFMRFQIDLVRRLYAESIPGIRLLGRRGQFAIAASAYLYQAILEKIEVNDYDVFNQRAFLTYREKLTRLPGIWWRTVRAQRPDVAEVSPVGDVEEEMMDSLQPKLADVDPLSEDGTGSKNLDDQELVEELFLKISTPSSGWEGK